MLDPELLVISSQIRHRMLLCLNIAKGESPSHALVTVFYAAALVLLDVMPECNLGSFVHYIFCCLQVTLVELIVFLLVVFSIFQD